MGLFVYNDLKEKGNYISSKLYKANSHDILVESQLIDASLNSYDIFLSHSLTDKDVVLGLKESIEEYNYSVYIDWIDDDQLDHEHVTKNNANTLKKRMNQSKCLLYATTIHYKKSIWMPWELGYFDGKKGRVAILPISTTRTSQFFGAEYLQLYPYITVEGIKDEKCLWVNDNSSTYVSFSDWLKGEGPTKY